MRNHRISSLLVCFALSLSIVLSSASSVFTFVGDEFNSKVISSENVWLIATIADGIDGSVLPQISSIFDSIDAKLAPYEISLGIIDCGATSNKKICKGIQSAHLPLSILLYSESPSENPYTHVMYRNPMLFQGVPSNGRSIEKFVSSSFSAKNVKSIDASAVEDVVTKIEKPSVFIMSDKSSPNLYVKSIASKFKGLDFIFVPNAGTFTYSSLSVKDVPSMFFLDSKNTNNIVNYDGVFSERKSVVSWLSDLASFENEKTTPRLTSSSSVKSDLEITENYLRSFLFVDMQKKSTIEGVVGVFSPSSTSIAGWEKAVGNCQGAIRSLEIQCKVPDDTDSDTNEKSTGQILCQEAISKGSFAFIIPRGSNVGEFSDIKNTASSSNLSKLLSKVRRYRGSEDWLKFIGQSLPDNAVEGVLDDPASLQQFIEVSIARQKMPVIILSDKAAPASTWKNLGLSIEENGVVGYVHIVDSSSPLLAQFGMTRVPAVVAFPPVEVPNSEKEHQIELRPVAYDPRLYGAFKISGLERFFKDIYAMSFFAKKNGMNADENQFHGESGKQELTVKEVEHDSEWKSLCSSTFKGVCIAYFYDGSEEQQLAGNELLSSISVTADANSKSLLDAVRVMTVNSKCQSNFLSQFALDGSSLPALMAISPFRLKAANFRGTMTKSSIADFVFGVLRGSVVTSPISELPSLESISQDCEEAIVEESSSIDEEDMDDMMAEILREEREKAEQLKKQLEQEEMERQRAAKEKKEADAKKKSKASKKKGKGKASKKTEEL